MSYTVVNLNRAHFDLVKGLLMRHCRSTSTDWAQSSDSICPLGKLVYMNRVQIEKTQIARYD